MMNDGLTKGDAMEQTTKTRMNLDDLFMSLVEIQDQIRAGAFQGKRDERTRKMVHVVEQCALITELLQDCVGEELGDMDQGDVEKFLTGNYLH